MSADLKKVIKGLLDNAFELRWINEKILLSDLDKSIHQIEISISEMNQYRDRLIKLRNHIACRIDENAENRCAMKLRVNLLVEDESKWTTAQMMNHAVDCIVTRETHSMFCKEGE